MRKEHIQVTDICTRCNPGNLFSHRFAGEERGESGGVFVFERVEGEKICKGFRNKGIHCTLNDIVRFID